jgi:hypothetical protein
MKRNNLLKLAVNMSFILAFCTLYYHPVFAQEANVTELHKKISSLEDRIKLLESLLKDSEQDVDEQIKDEFGWQNKKNWRNLAIGMTENEVQELLGDPVKSIMGVRTLWYYPNIYCGYVSFDEKGHLIGWNEP